MVDDAAINAWAETIGLGQAAEHDHAEIRAAARAALALADTLRALDPPEQS